jgi:hypothetical protein
VLIEADHLDFACVMPLDIVGDRARPVRHNAPAALAQMAERRTRNA